ncbi:MAG: hypothetical protein AAF843_04450 [Bacteroidota bacterium]
MPNFNYNTRDLSSGIHLLGVILIFSSLFVLLTPHLFEYTVSLSSVYWLSGVSFLIGICIISTYSGTIIHLRDRKIKEYSAFMGFQFGKWQALPTLSHVRHTTQKRKVTNFTNGVSPTLSGNVTFHYIILLNIENEPVYTFSFSKEKKALKKLNQLAEGLNLKVLHS